MLLVGRQKPHHKFVQSKTMDTNKRKYLVCVEASRFSLIAMRMLMPRSSPYDILGHVPVVRVCRFKAKCWYLFRKHACDYVTHLAYVLLVVVSERLCFISHGLTWLSSRHIVCFQSGHSRLELPIFRIDDNTFEQ